MWLRQSASALRRLGLGHRSGSVPVSPGVCPVGPPREDGPMTNVAEALRTSLGNAVRTRVAGPDAATRAAELFRPTGRGGSHRAGRSARCTPTHRCSWVACGPSRCRRPHGSLRKPEWSATPAIASGCIVCNRRARRPPMNIDASACTWRIGRPVLEPPRPVGRRAPPPGGCVGAGDAGPDRVAEGAVRSASATFVMGPSSRGGPTGRRGATGTLPERWPSPNCRSATADWRDRMPKWVPWAIAIAWAGFIATLVLRWTFARLSGLLIILVVSLFLALAIEPGVNHLAGSRLAQGTGDRRDPAGRLRGGGRVRRRHRLARRAPDRRPARQLREVRQPHGHLAQRHLQHHDRPEGRQQLDQRPARASCNGSSIASRATRCSSP